MLDKEKRWIMKDGGYRRWRLKNGRYRKTWDTEKWREKKMANLKKAG